MTPKPKPPRVCDECRYDGGIHYSVPEDGGEIVATRCPNYRSAELHAQALQLAEKGSDARTEAIRRTITDAAEILPVLSANDVQAQLEAGGMDGGGAIGAAFSWAARHGYIEATGRVVKSSRPGTKGHHVFEYRSLTYRKAAEAS